MMGWATSFLRTFCMISICSFSATCIAQSKQEKTATLCDLQRNVARGEHVQVLLSSVYVRGPENSRLEESGCQVTPYQTTWVEFELKSESNKEKLWDLLDRSGRASVVLEGEFYGPPLPDPRLPEALRKSYEPNWGHMGCCRTKLVVTEIREANVAPPNVRPSRPVTEDRGSNENSQLCDKIRFIKRLPFQRDESAPDAFKGIDSVYGEFRERGNAMIPCLIAKVTDRTGMEDPTQAPHAGRVAVGDVAFWVFLDITGMDLVDALPPSVREDYKERGRYAYLDWIRKGLANRKTLQANLRKWVEGHPPKQGKF